MIDKMLESTPCRVVLPTYWQEVDGPPNGAPTAIGDDRRRFPRNVFRDQALMQSLPTLPAIARTDELFAVMTRDVSRGGVSFLHVAELYPSEELVLWTRGGRMRCRVVRCRKHNSSCYEVGVTFRHFESH